MQPNNTAETILINSSSPAFYCRYKSSQLRASQNTVASARLKPAKTNFIRFMGCGFWIPGTEFQTPPQWMLDSKRARFQFVAFGQMLNIAFRFTRRTSLGGFYFIVGRCKYKMGNKFYRNIREAN